jgi:phosphoglycerate dehydrogenase-like enzyme
MSETSHLRVAVGPSPAPTWVGEAIEAGGGAVVELSGADALVWLDPLDPPGLQSMLDDAPSVRWVQLPWAGVEEYAAAGVFGDGRTWTCGKGVYAEPVAEHALMLALAGLRHVPERVTARSWGPMLGRSLYDGRVTILGGGGIARSLLALLEPLRVEATVVRRRAEPVPGAARTVDLDELPTALGSADVVVVALSLTPETRAVIARPQLAAMQPHAWLVNVARGGHVVTDDLVAALADSVIAGAALDVTDPEPLPDGHPLWDAPNCIITPHSADTPEMIRPLLAARIRENVRRFAAGEELIGPVDPALGY